MRGFLHNLAGILVMAILGAIAAATLVRFAPGFEVDEREFDPRLSPASIQALREARVADRNLFRFYANYFRGIAHGDFGVSNSLKRPVGELLAERGPVTLRLAASGLIGGWVLGLAFGIAASQRSRALDFAASAVSSIFLCLPAALIGLLILFARGSWWWAIALILFPKIFSYSRNLLKKVSVEPHVLLARAKGLGSVRIFTYHIVPLVLPEMLALAGVSVSVALSAAIPIETICDVPGVGQLAWQAALGRDLPVLVTLTFLLAMFTRAANLAADCAVRALRMERA